MEKEPTLEREITVKNGTLAKNLPKFFYWQRLPDLPMKNQHRKPYDGLLWFKNRCWPIEVKMGSSKLTEGEIKAGEEFGLNEIEYLVLRYYQQHKLWILEKFGKEWSREGQDLRLLLEELVD